ncbi:MAG: hypothetical protein LBI18_02605 [Planctomycetaceae bacterium]|jgi:hypothetical protein|nr:hypothetical protein [Planctomycetaceae bacterium]
MIILHKYLLRIFVLVLLISNGCSQSIHEELPPLYPCSITVTQEGKPFDGVNVSLIRQDGDTTWVVCGITNSSGVAKIQTQMRYSGAPEGKYKVRISKIVTEGQPKLVSSGDAEQPLSIGDIPSYFVIDPKYDNVKTTPFEIFVTNGKNKQSFDVGQSIKQPVSDQ